MNAQSCRPNHAPWITPYVMVKHVENAVHFYEQSFGFEIVQVVPGEDNTGWHAELKYKDHLIMFGKSGAYGDQSKTPNDSAVECPITLYLYCENVDAFYTHAIKTGAKSLGAPENMFWGDRMCKLQDPEGYIWCFATYLGEN